MSGDEPSVWIRTVPDTSGTYRVVLEIDDDTSHPLDAAAAMTYSRAVLSAVARAEHDAAIVRQMRKISDGNRNGLQMAAELVGSIRADRPPIAWPTPLQLDPGVSMATGDAFLRVLVKGKPVGQWTPGDARDHALGILEAVEVAELDGAYLRALRSMNIDDAPGRSVIDDLVNHRSVSGCPR